MGRYILVSENLIHLPKIMEYLNFDIFGTIWTLYNFGNFLLPSLDLSACMIVSNVLLSWNIPRS